MGARAVCASIQREKKTEQPPKLYGQPGKALFHELRRGDDGVVVAHLGAVQDAADLRGERRTLHERIGAVPGQGGLADRH